MTQLQEEQNIKLSPVALEGAMTREGGTVVITEGIERAIVDGYRVAVVGDAVHYSDSRVGHIVTGSRAPVTCHDVPFAIIGSTIDNGDVIISTPSESVEVV